MSAPNRPTSTLSLVAHAGALVLIYSVYSLLQEKIMKTTYLGPDGHPAHFTSSSLLVLSNRLFSLLAGIAFSLFLPSPPSSTTTELSTQERLGHKWPLSSYALVAAANFASTYCQYDALRYVGFTTQALAKCAKMVPVLLIGTFFYKKSYKQKEYVAGGVVLFGCFVYLVSRPSDSLPSSSHKSHTASSTSTSTDSPLAPVFGSALLCLYLFFDGLTSTTQEHYFGKSKRDAPPLTPGGPVLDQMVWVNAVASVIALVLCAASWEKTSASLALAFSDSALMFDVFMLSATATFGLVILYDTIFKHGALTVATTMTLRQFFSILLNAGMFGNFALIGFGGWLGVGFVAAGVFIKMDRRFDQVSPARASSIPSANAGPSDSTAVPLLVVPDDNPGGEKRGAGEGDKTGSEPQPALPLFLDTGVREEDESAWNRLRLLGLQYGIPLAVPPMFAMAVSVFI